MNIKSSNNPCIIGYNKIFFELKKLFDNDILPNKIIFSGINGIGKSTAINLLSGSVRPNLGDWQNPPPDWEEVVSAFPRGELRDYLGLVSEGEVSIAVKPQYIDKLPKLWDGKVRGLLSRVDDRGDLEECAKRIAVDHLLEREL